MSDHQGRRRSNPSDPTAERTSEPVPVGDDVVDRDRRRQDTPRESGKEDVDPVIPADDEGSTLNTKM
jgi:hypothetical protein